MSWLDNYPYTNFHETNLDWFLNKFKELLGEFDRFTENILASWEAYKTEMNLNFANLSDEFDALRTYVMDYFANLDVQEEINNKLHDMDEDGTLDALVAPIIAQWLATHITPTTPPVDNTLTISGAAADAKVAGDEIRGLKDDLTYLTLNSANGHFYFQSADFINGDIYSSGAPSGVIANYQKAYTKQMQKFPETITIKANGIFRARIVYYSSDVMSSDTKTGQHEIGYNLPDTEEIISANQYFAILVWKAGNDSPLPIDEAQKATEIKAVIYEQIANDIEVVADTLLNEVDDLKDDLIYLTLNSTNGRFYFQSADFINGDIYSSGAPSGVIANYQKAYTKQMQKFPETITIKANGIFRARIVYYSSDVMSADTKTGEHVIGYNLADSEEIISANQYFAILVWKVGVDDPLPIDEAQKATEIKAVIYEQIANDIKAVADAITTATDKIKYDLYYGHMYFLDADFKNGYLSSGGSIIQGDGTDYRCYTSKMQKFPYELTVKVNVIPYRAVINFYSTDIINSAYKTDTTIIGYNLTDQELTIPANQYFAFYVYKVGDTETALAPETAQTIVIYQSILDKITTNEQRISVLENYQNYSANLPDYWITYLETKIPELRQIEENLTTGVEFIFITDVHMPRNTLNSPGVINYIMRMSNMPFVINGGDWLDLSETKQAGIDLFYNWRYLMGDVKEFCVIGNHDYNQVGSSDPSIMIPSTTFYDVLIKPIENDIISDGHVYYYMDNSNQKFRWIIVDDAIARSANEQAWLQARLTELESDWTALVVSHYLYSYNGEISEIGEELINTINDVYNQINATFIGILSGHAHFDKVENESVNGYKLITTTTDTMSYTEPVHVRGTVNEQAFDAVYIDTTLKTIYMKRIGTGSDRTITY